tara:strand:+ start:10393 stop:11799 length:1407 start_codon:yes stop_codon:yes gene_type:complete
MTTRLDLCVCKIAESRISGEAVSKIMSRAASVFHESSGGDIELQIVPRNDPFNGDYSGNISDGHLHGALYAMTGRQNPQAGIKKIGLVIADRYESLPGAFGIMFDQRFVPNSSSRYLRVPREGCAVFLNAIASKRQSDERRRELAFTVIHELGHVFNLQHTNATSFMRQSAGRPHAFKYDAFEFTQDDQYRLSQCTASRHIRPGGSAFEDLGDMANANTQKQSQLSTALDLRIDLSSREFWRFEPVELDVQLFANGSRKKSVKIPNVMDPGHPQFCIWIDEPDGERRRYRPERRFCGGEGTLTLKPGETWWRDLPFFGQAGGYTFSKPGIHAIQVTLESLALGRVESNKLAVNVLAARQDDPLYASAKSCFEAEAIGMLMHYRSFINRLPPGTNKLRDYCDAFSDHASAGMGRYKLGRALVRRLKQDGKESIIGRYRRLASADLKQAIADRSLGDGRRSKAEKDLLSL